MSLYFLKVWCVCHCGLQGKHILTSKRNHCAAHYPGNKHIPLLLYSSNTSARFFFFFAVILWVATHIYRQRNRSTQILVERLSVFQELKTVDECQAEHCSQTSCVGACGHIRLPGCVLECLLRRKRETCKRMATIGDSASYFSTRLDLSSIVPHCASSSNWNENCHSLFFFPFMCLEYLSGILFLLAHW